MNWVRKIGPNGFKFLFTILYKDCYLYWEGDNLFKLDFIGDNYSRIIEVFNEFYNEKYICKTGNVYFDCANYYFEIDV